MTFNALISGFRKERILKQHLQFSRIMRLVILRRLCKEGKCSETEELSEDMPRQSL